MQRLFLMLTLFLVVACGGASEHRDDVPTESGGIDWTATEGLIVTLSEPVEVGAEIELGQAFKGPLSLRIDDPLTIDEQPIAGVVLEHAADSDGAGLLISSFTRAEPLSAGTVLEIRVVNTGDGLLVRPNRAWLAIDGLEVARAQW